MEETKKCNKHIKIMGVIGIIMSILGLLQFGKFATFLMLGLLPMFCIVAFMKKKQAVFGIGYTVLFVINRIAIVIHGTLLAKLFIILLLAYFVYVVYITIKSPTER